jgi:CHAT domain-containing protein
MHFLAADVASAGLALRAFGLALALLWAPLATAQADALALQQRAIKRIDDFVAHYRLTGDFASQRGELAAADAELSQSNQALQNRGEWSAAALGLIKQGSVWRMQAEWDRAIGLYREAEQAAQRGRNPTLQADALAWRALAETSNNQHGQAHTNASRAVTLAQAGADKNVLARALDILGTVQVAQRDLAGAADTFNREVALTAETSDPMAIYYAYFNRADVFLKLAEKCDFQQDAEPCLKSVDLARADLERAQGIVRKLGYAGLDRSTQDLIGGVERRRSLIRMRQSSQNAIASIKAFQPTRASDVLVSEKFVAAGSSSDAPQLQALVQESKRLEQRLGGFAKTSHATSIFTDGLMLEMQGRHDAALETYLRAVEAIERDRSALGDERSRTTYMENRIGIYYAPVLQLLERQRHAQAFELLERSRSRALADLLASRRPDLRGTEEQALYAEVATLRAQIADLQGQLFELAAQPDTARRSAQGKALQGRIAADESRYRTALERMARQAPRLHTLVDAAPASLAALQASMRAEGYETLQYLVTESAVIVWHISADSVVVRNVFLPRAELVRKVAGLNRRLRDPQTAFDPTGANELFLFLVQPVLARLRSERLVVIAHEDLANLPFQVLRNPADGRYLGEQFQISYAPSATVLLGLRRSAPLAGARVLALADPALPAAVPEVQAIAKLFPGRSLVQADALVREKSVKTMVADYDVIHLAVHGNFDAGEPMLSHLGLARGDGDDGKLTAAEMFGLPLARNRLVVLSACETGRTEATHANEVLGMSRALLYAGASTLVLSSWKVDSEATTTWMHAFYEAAVSRPIAEAARTALLRVKGEAAYAHPYYWAPFTIVGR